MAEFIGEMLFAIMRGLIVESVYSTFVKVGTWLDGRSSKQALKVAVGMLLGLGLYFFIPIVPGLLVF